MMMPSFQPQDFLILIVDDLPDNLRVVGSMLDRVGYATTFANSGVQALERFHSAAPDLILLDLMMPELDGLVVCQTLKADPNYSNLPIIMLTASHEREHLLKAFDHGAVDYITKPFNQQELLARVKTHLMLKHTYDQLKKALTAMEHLARTDTLTGLLNRRSLFEVAEQEFVRAQRYQIAFSVLMLDIDHFKRINDTFGHQIGDLALQTLATTLKTSFRAVDCIGRYGGEEFVVILPATSLPEAIEVAERIRCLVADLVILTPTQNLYLTISTGIATFETTDLSIDQILNRADTALYQAKARGRNTWVAQAAPDFLLLTSELNGSHLAPLTDPVLVEPEATISETSCPLPY